MSHLRVGNLLRNLSVVSVQINNNTIIGYYDDINKQFFPYVIYKIPRSWIEILSGILPTETECLIIFYLEDGRPKIHVPEQNVGSASVSWKHWHIENQFGTLHTHPFGSSSVFHSGVDLDDEMKYDGIHFVLDNTTKALSAHISINKVTIKINPSDCFTPLFLPLDVKQLKEEIEKNVTKQIVDRRCWWDRQPFNSAFKHIKGLFDFDTDCGRG